MKSVWGWSLALSVALGACAGPGDGGGPGAGGGRDAAAPDAARTANGRVATDGGGQRLADGTPIADAAPRGDGTLPEDAVVRGDGALPEDAGVRGDAAPDAGPSCATPSDAAPIEAPARAWTWVPVDGMRCADGSPTGIAVNFAPGATRMMIYLLGGGACWDERSCYRDGRAAFVADGFGPDDFAGLNPAAFWFFDRGAAQNPFADHHLVFVPYCTGDLHAGDRVARYGGRATHHVGAPNYTALIERLAATFPDLERVIVVGGSAGGYGALFNWARTRAAFPCARVDLVNDAGTPLASPHFPPARRQLWNDAWNLAATLPPDCPACLDDWGRLFDYNLSRAPEARGALLTSMEDGVLSAYMEIDGRTFSRGVEALLAGVTSDRFAAFLVAGETHVLMASPVVADGRTVPEWLGAMQADDPGWETVGPDPLPDCDALADCGACALCATQGPCAAEFAACERVDGCPEAVACAMQCAPGDAQCLGACAAALGGHVQVGVDLYTCVRCNQCGALCGACP